MQSIAYWYIVLSLPMIRYMRTLKNPTTIQVFATTLMMLSCLTLRNNVKAMITGNGSRTMMTRDGPMYVKQGGISVWLCVAFVGDTRLEVV